MGQGRHAGATLMGEIIQVAFGSERDWQRARSHWSEGLAAVGALFGDDEALMRAKAECFYQLLRRIVEDIPAVRVTVSLPEDLSADHTALLTAAIREATLKGIEVSTCHAVRMLTAAIFDLCTSKLRTKPS
jgi:hypothetical protein